MSDTSKVQLAEINQEMERAVEGLMQYLADNHLKAYLSDEALEVSCVLVGFRRAHGIESSNHRLRKDDLL